MNSISARALRALPVSVKIEEAEPANENPAIQPARNQKDAQLLLSLALGQAQPETSRHLVSHSSATLLPDSSSTKATLACNKPADGNRLPSTPLLGDRTYSGGRWTEPQRARSADAGRTNDRAVDRHPATQSSRASPYQRQKSPNALTYIPAGLQPALKSTISARREPRPAASAAATEALLEVDEKTLRTPDAVLRWLHAFDEACRTGFVPYLCAKFRKMMQRPRGTFMESADSTSIAKSMQNRGIPEHLIKPMMLQMKGFLEDYKRDPTDAKWKLADLEPLDTTRMLKSNKKLDFDYIVPYLAENYPHVAFRVGEKFQAICERLRQKTRTVRQQDMASLNNAFEHCDCQELKDQLSNLPVMRELHEHWKADATAWPQKAA